MHIQPWPVDCATGQGFFVLSRDLYTRQGLDANDAPTLFKIHFMSW